jgi:DNA-binding FadR family transcriptional regulator
MTEQTAFLVNPIRRDSVITKAAEEICRFIERTALTPGERLPAEVALAQMLGISRNSLREALRVLVGLGFVEKRPDKGLVVKSPLGSTGRHDGEVLSLDRSAVAAAAPVAFQVRAVIEGRCAELASETATADDLAEIAAHLHRFRSSLDAGDFVVASQEHLLFHDAIVAAAKNPILASIYYQVRFVTSEIGQMGAPKLYKSREHLPVHEQMLDALTRRDKALILTSVAAHFKTIGRLTEFIAGNEGARVARLGPGDE